MQDSKQISRRTFLKGAVGAGLGASVFSIIPASAMGRAIRSSPGNKIVMGCIGVGGQGTSDMYSFLFQPDTRIVAVCDVDKDHLANAKKIVDQHYGNQDCAAYVDFRELLARDDLDAISLATPDHWHCIPAIQSLNAGLDVYGEKPISHCLREGRMMCDAQVRNGRIWQTGSWQRSVENFRFACELVRNGRIGKVMRCEVGLPTGVGIGPVKFKDPPPQLDYDFWLGPSRWAPYCDQRTHWNWRWQLDYGGGQLMDWIGHHGDIAHWGMGFDRSGPSEVEGHGEFPATDAIWNTTGKYRIEALYKKEVTGYSADVPFTIAGGYPEIRGGVKWIGTDGWVWVNRGGFDASNPEWKKYKNLPDELAKVKLYVSNNHWRNFLDCVKSRQPTITPVETAHHSTIPGHLGLISMLVGRKIHWNVKHEKILGDPAASELLTRPYRAPWHLG